MQRLTPDTDDAAGELHAPLSQRRPLSTPTRLEGNQSSGVEGGSSASSLADAAVDSFNPRHYQSQSSVRGLDATDIEAAREKVAAQHEEDAERIRREQKSKRHMVEAWALKQRAACLEWKAAELIRREIDGESDSGSETESMATPDEEETGSQYALTEVFSESEQQAWTTATPQQQGLVLHRHYALPMEEL